MSPTGEQAQIAADTGRLSIEDKQSSTTFITSSHVHQRCCMVQACFHLGGASTLSAHGVAASASGAPDRETKPDASLAITFIASPAVSLTGPIQALAMPHVSSGKHAATAMQPDFAFLILRSGWFLCWVSNDWSKQPQKAGQA